MYRMREIKDPFICRCFYLFKKFIHYHIDFASSFLSMPNAKLTRGSGCIRGDFHLPIHAGSSCRALVRTANQCGPMRRRGNNCLTLLSEYYILLEDMADKNRCQGKNRKGSLNNYAISCDLSTVRSMVIDLIQGTPLRKGG